MEWDAVVIGSGFGGGAVAHTLTRAGLRTLVVERGGWPRRDALDWSGRAVMIEGRYEAGSPLGVRQYGAGAAVDRRLNAVVGGNSIFFGGAALRLRPLDFADWPITYAALEPYYARAEELLEVHGQAGADPHEPPRSTDYPAPPPPLSRPARRIAEAATALGLKPFPIPIAINHSGRREPACPGCGTCDGFPCRIGAKNDVTTTLLHKAAHDQLAIADGIVATRLVADGRRVASVELLDPASGQLFSVRGRLFVLAAGAIGSAALFLRSGLAARDPSGLAGRRLMRHCNAMVSYFFPRQVNPEQVNHKQICLADLYEDERATTGRAVGIVQDMMMPPADVVRLQAPRGLGWGASLVASHLQALICIAEDDPNPDNRVHLGDRHDEQGLPVTLVDHAYGPADERRRDLLLRLAGKVLRKAGGLVGATKKADSFSHAVGTLGFGADPKGAVFDRDCRFPALPNLFVADGSFMPTSGGVNPSLTITANGLRVAEKMIEQLRGR